MVNIAEDMANVIAAINSLENLFKENENTEELFCYAKEMFTLQVEMFKILTASGKQDRFMAVVDANLSSQQSIVDFIHNYTERNDETLRKIFRVKI